MARELEYANFHCKFGSEINLIDLAEEIVLPAFFDRQLVREFKKAETTYFIHRPQIVTIGTEDGIPIVAVTGRFVKNTVIVRSQIFDRDLDEIIQRQIELKSAPSAFFTLVLNDHQLLYVRETGDAPLPKTFGTTMKIFINIKYEEYIRSLQAEDREFAQIDERRPISLTALRERIPKPDVHLVPLTTSDLPSDFLSRFEVLDILKFRVLTPNPSNLNPFFEDIADVSRDVKSTAGELTFKKQGEEGLSIDGARRQIAAAADSSNSGNIEIEYSGRDAAGQKIKGDNEDLKVTTPFDLDTRGVESNTTIAKRMWNKFLETITHGILIREPSGADPEIMRQRLSRIQNQTPDWNSQGATRPNQ